MPDAANTNGTGGGDDLDDLFNFNVDTDDVLQTLETNATQKKPGDKPFSKNGADLVIDEAIQISKARRPVPKLDQDRYDTIAISPFTFTQRRK